MSEPMTPRMVDIIRGSKTGGSREGAPILVLPLDCLSYEGP